MTNVTASNREFLAFVHIEKAAGTTLIHSLRRGFFLRYLDVRPLSADANDVFRARDLAKCLKVNPMLRAFGGHAVRPLGDLKAVYPGVRFIVIMREPIKRYLSQYRYGVAALGRNVTFEEFLQDRCTHDFQTKKIAGAGDLRAAKRALREQFAVVGVVEKLDEFLVLVNREMLPRRSHLTYEIKNVGTTAMQTDTLMEQFGPQIRAVNSLDLELYDYVVDNLLPAQRAAYGPKFEADLEQFVAGNRIDLLARLKYFVDGFCRKVYFEPATGLIRKFHGLPMAGSY